MPPVPPSVPVTTGLFALLLAGVSALAQEPHVTLAGWYLRHQGTELLQPCGAAHPVRIIGSTDLAAQARRFELQEDTPVYVKLVAERLATPRNGADERGHPALRVERVIQFGSPTPVRDCPLTGVALPAESTPRMHP